MVRALVCLLLCAASLAAGCGGGGSGTNTGISSTDTGGQISKSAPGIVVEKVACKVLGSESEDDAADAIEARGDGDELAGALLADVVIATVEAGCPALVDEAEDAIGRHLFGRTASAEGEPPTTRAFANALQATTTATVAHELHVPTQTVSNTVSAVCNIFASAGLQNPLVPIQTSFPSADISDVGAMNGVMSLVLDRCSPNSRQMADLSSAVISYLISAGSAHYAPPAFVGPVVSSIAQNPTEDNIDIATISWLPVGSQTIIKASIWWRDPTSHFASLGFITYERQGLIDHTRVYDIPKGQTLQFALAVEDSAGTWSSYQYTPWVYMR
jgi:hypothetical protein